MAYGGGGSGGSGGGGGGGAGGASTSGGSSTSSFARINFSSLNLGKSIIKRHIFFDNHQGDGGMASDQYPSAGTVGVGSNVKEAHGAVDYASSEKFQGPICLFLAGQWGGDTVRMAKISTPGTFAGGFGNRYSNTYYVSGGMSCGTTAVFGGSNSSSPIHGRMEVRSFIHSGDSNLFADLNQARSASGNISNGHRGIIAGGDPNIDTTEYVNLSQVGVTSVDFGELGTNCRNSGMTTNGSHYYYYGGKVDANNSDTTQIEVGSFYGSGGTSDFSVLSQKRTYPSDHISNKNRSIVIGGQSYNSGWTQYDVQDVFNFAISGQTAVDHGEAITVGNWNGGSDGSRGLLAGGFVAPNTYGFNLMAINIGVGLGQGVSVDFGEPDVGMTDGGGCSGG